VDLFPEVLRKYDGKRQVRAVAIPGYMRLIMFSKELKMKILNFLIIISMIIVFSPQTAFSLPASRIEWEPLPIEALTDIQSAGDFVSVYFTYWDFTTSQYDEVIQAWVEYIPWDDVVTGYGKNCSLTEEWELMYEGTQDFWDLIDHLGTYPDVFFSYDEFQTVPQIVFPRPEQVEKVLRLTVTGDVYGDYTSHYFCIEKYLVEDSVPEIEQAFAYFEDNFLDELLLNPADIFRVEPEPQ
jgi:hypothetical protein